MRKKLFAVIMSAMMMVTFMPAMAFAGWTPAPSPAQRGFYIDGTKADLFNVAGDPTGVYDGEEHAVTYNVLANSGVTVTGYTMAYDATTPVTTGDTAKYTKTDAPKFKNAGWYAIRAYVKATDTEDPTTHVVTAGATTVETVWVHVTKRKVLVSAKNSTAYVMKEKNYDGKGVVISDADFNITPLWDATKKDYVRANTGLVAGETLLDKAVETPADASIYKVADLVEKSVNPNYDAYIEGATHADADLRPFIGSVSARGFDVQILKADNAAKIASQNLTIKRGSKKAVKFSATFGTAKLTKLSGNTKISVKNGKIKVAKSCKKGTFKVKVKASVAGNANYASASRVKTLTIKVY